jgi:hypothetical protein
MATYVFACSPMAAHALRSDQNLIMSNLYYIYVFRTACTISSSISLLIKGNEKAVQKLELL